jgi:hypothetical protein
MTNPIGHQTGSAAYWNGASYTKQEKGFDVFGNSLGVTVTIPSSTEGTTLGSSCVVMVFRIATARGARCADRDGLLASGQARH